MDFIKSLMCPKLDARLSQMRERAKEVRDPSTEDDTLQLLLTIARLSRPERILEIGTAEGLTSVALLCECENARLTTIELDEERYRKAKENFALFGVEDRVNAILGDAADVLPSLEGEFGLIFLDGPKVQYKKYLSDCKRLLCENGVLFADDVLLYGWVDGRAETPAKRKMLVEHIREYLREVSSDPDFITSILETGEGAAVSVKKTSYESAKNENGRKAYKGNVR